MVLKVMEVTARKEMSIYSESFMYSLSVIGHRLLVCTLRERDVRLPTIPSSALSLLLPTNVWSHASRDEPVPSPP